MIAAGSLSLTHCAVDPVETDLLLFVDYSNMPENMVLTDFHTDKIEIKIRAHPAAIEQINARSIRYPVDMYTDLEFDPAGDSNSIEPGAYLIPVDEKRIPMNPDIQILSVSPSYLTVQLDRKLQKSFRVTVPYVGQPAKGYIALEAITDPDRIELTGAATLIQSILELKTRPVDISNVKEGFKKEVPLNLNTSSIIFPSHPVVKVSVPVQQQLVSRTLEAIPIQIRNAEAAASIKPRTIMIQVKGPFETLEDEQLLKQIEAFIDLSHLTEGVYVRHVNVNIPVGLMMTDASPQVFTITIE